eukprot:NODE_3668_length_757_cov_415.549858.p4 GENE.NODE_3668_length_757_cov_415.549858~~NODE_3668_length_757_cov_415.549858.p4  ORF type:complete len:147 (+),score=26.22 NODE_3668_length_757_cov_415.549858:3-443(+)
MGDPPSLVVEMPDGREVGTEAVLIEFEPPAGPPAEPPTEPPMEPPVEPLPAEPAESTEPAAGPADADAVAAPAGEPPLFVSEARLAADVSEVRNVVVVAEDTVAAVADTAIPADEGVQSPSRLHCDRGAQQGSSPLMWSRGEEAQY